MAWEILRVRPLDTPGATDRRAGWAPSSELPWHPVFRVASPRSRRRKDIHEVAALRSGVRRFFSPVVWVWSVRCRSDRHGRGTRVEERADLPTHLRFDFGGGTVTLQVVVDSARPLRAVTAELTRQDVAGATPRVQPLIPEGAGTFVASIPVPANIEVGGATARYRLTIYAEDSEGVRSQPLHYDIQVAAPDSSGLPGQPQ